MKPTYSDTHTLPVQKPLRLKDDQHEGPVESQTADGVEDRVPGARWSKDSVEHLRTIHFTLIIVAAGLVFFPFPRYDANSALNDLESITKLKNDWSLNFLKNLHHIDSPHKHFGEINGKTFENISADVGVSVMLKDGRIRRFLFPKNNWLITDKDDTIVESAPGRPDEDLVSHFPDTIADFEPWWDSLYDKGFYVNYPDTIASQVSIFDKQNNDTERPVHPIDNKADLFPSSDELVITNDKVLNSTSKITYSFLDANEDSFQFPITTTSLHVLQEDISTRYNKDWKKGYFRQTFPDLKKASAKVEQLSLDDLKSRLEREADGGPEVLDVFGLKIHADKISDTGTVLLLAIQLYFVVNLKELSRKLSSDDAGWDIPWLGMYQAGLPRLLYLLTTGILPPLVIASLFRQMYMRALARLRHPLLHEQGSAATAIAVACIVVIISCILGWMTWKYRPQVQSRAQLY